MRLEQEYTYPEIESPPDMIKPQNPRGASLLDPRRDFAHGALARTMPRSPKTVPWSHSLNSPSAQDFFHEQFFIISYLSSNLLKANMFYVIFVSMCFIPSVIY